MTPAKLNRTLIFNQRSALGSAYSHNRSIVVKTITVANVATVGDDQRSHNLSWNVSFIATINFVLR